MPILECSCGKKYNLKEGSASPGTTIPCRACGRPMTVPEAAPPADGTRAAELENRIKQLEQSLAGNQSEYRKMEAELEEARTRLEVTGNAEERIAELETTVAGLQEAEWQRTRAERDLSAAKASLELEQASRKKAEGEIIVRDNRVKALEEEVSKLKHAAETLSASTGEMKQLKSSLQARDAEVRELKETVEDRDSEMMRLKDELEEVHKREKWFEMKIADLESAGKESQRDLYEARTQTNIRIKAEGQLRGKALEARHFALDIDRNLDSVAMSLKGLQERVRRLKEALDVIEAPSPLPPETPVARESPPTPVPSSASPAPAAPAADLAETPPGVPDDMKIIEEVPTAEGAPEAREEVAEEAPAGAEGLAPSTVEEPAGISARDSTEAPIQEGPEPLEEDFPAGETVAEAPLAEEIPAEATAEGDVPLIDMSESPAEESPAEAEAAESAPAKPAPETETKKKGFFSRLFGKK